MANSEPLTEEDLVQINERLDDLTQADLIIDKAIRAGIDMAEPKKTAAETRVQLMKIKQAFFPGR